MQRRGAGEQREPGGEKEVVVRHCEGRERTRPTGVGGQGKEVEMEKNGRGPAQYGSSEGEQGMTTTMMMVMVQQQRSEARSGALGEPSFTLSPYCEDFGSRHSILT